jgi:hypothetical protein
MTRKVENWWLQRRHTFHYLVEGDYLRVLVSDDLDPSEIELDRRSAGMQYFCSWTRPKTRTSTALVRDFAARHRPGQDRRVPEGEV